MFESSERRMIKGWKKIYPVNSKQTSFQQTIKSWLKYFLCGWNESLTASFSYNLFHFNQYRQTANLYLSIDINLSNNIISLSLSTSTDFVFHLIWKHETKLLDKINKNLICLMLVFLFFSATVFFLFVLFRQREGESIFYFGVN